MEIEQQLAEILPADRIRARYIDRISFASDAGFYHLVPRAVVQPVDEAEIIALFAFSHRHRMPLVFRGGGTSLSGQSITDGILVDLSRHWDRIQVEAGGEQVRVQPGITGAMVNAFLKNHRRKIGPDPSSISAAMMGGILSNNSSGMCCGVALNSYHTTRYIRFILPDGKTFNTENPQDYLRFEQECSALAQTLLFIKNQISRNQALYNKIRHKYQSKTTVGYSLNAFIDYEHPLDILAHLLIGAEGTLAFIAEAVLQTVPDYPCKSTALLYFTNMYSACQAIRPLIHAGAMMVELMDRASLRAVENLPGMPAIVKTLPEQAAALLIEFQEDNPAALEQRVNQFLSSVSALSLLNDPVFTTDAREQDLLWKMRKGLFPAVGAVRASGTTVILEDLAFPIDQLGDAITDLQKLFQKYAYHNAIIFGHAKDGNIHFVVTQSFNSEEEVARYDRFIQEVVSLVVEKYDGTLKAEHGTGRNMAPFVVTEWGEEAYQIMKTLKEAVDPEGLLNPGVIVNPDKTAHLKDLKALPTVEEEVDRCIECGYCEHKCPSRDLTATPRRRIVVRRALQLLDASGNKKQYRQLLDEYRYDGLDTCAVDGLCATACPVDINTGDLVKRLRSENHSVSANKVALWAARHFGALEWAARTALKTGFALNGLFGEKTMSGLTKALKQVFPTMPLWTAQMASPPALIAIQSAQNIRNAAAETAIVYFPSCISRMMGTYTGKKQNALEVLIGICQKAGIAVVMPERVSDYCCSQIFSSKGFKDARSYMANRVVVRLWESSGEGRLPIVTDVSSCAYTLHQLRPVLTDANRAKFDRLKVLDSVDFLHDMVLPRVEVKRKKQEIVLHPVCALEKMGTVHKLAKIAGAFAHEVTIPRHAGCCGMAGDRGFLFPELTAAATRPEAVEVAQKNYDGYYSSTKTCEMALSEAVKKNYESVLYLVAEGL